jgi:hypothetical protein
MSFSFAVRVIDDRSMISWTTSDHYIYILEKYKPESLNSISMIRMDMVAIICNNYLV